MNSQQLKAFLSTTEDNGTISYKEVLEKCFGGKEPSVAITLLYGYTLERNDFHVYVEDGLLHVIVYGYKADKPESYTSSSSICAFSMIPDKRVHPCRTLETFARLMKEKGADSIPFTSASVDDEEALTENNLYCAGLTAKDF